MHGKGKRFAVAESKSAKLDEIDIHGRKYMNVTGSS
jgi:hypothetical protein